jgi:hypothetical protein
MKIESRRLNGATPIRKTVNRDPRPGESFQVETPAAPSEPAQLTGLGGASAIGAVLLAQEEDTPQSRQRKSMRRADDLLDRLDEIRLSLLSGRIAMNKLEALQRALANRLESSDNPKLQETLDAIDLRVAVELAKYHA